MIISPDEFQPVNLTPLLVIIGYKHWIKSPTADRLLQAINKIVNLIAASIVKTVYFCTRCHHPISKGIKILALDEFILHNV